MQFVWQIPILHLRQAKFPLQWQLHLSIVTRYCATGSLQLPGKNLLYLNYGRDFQTFCFTAQVYVTMDYCKRLGYASNTTDQSCIKSFHIFNGDHLVHIERPKFDKVPRIIVDGSEEKVPFKKSWINMREVHGKEMLLSLLESNVDLQVSYDDMVYTVSLDIMLEALNFNGRLVETAGCVELLSLTVFLYLSRLDILLR